MRVLCAVVRTDHCAANSRPSSAMLERRVPLFHPSLDAYYNQMRGGINLMGMVKCSFRWMTTSTEKFLAFLLGMAESRFGACGGAVTVSNNQMCPPSLGLKALLRPRPTVRLRPAGIEFLRLQPRTP